MWSSKATNLKAIYQQETSKGNYLKENDVSPFTMTLSIFPSAFITFLSKISDTLGPWENLFSTNLGLQSQSPHPLSWVECQNTGKRVVLNQLCFISFSFVTMKCFVSVPLKWSFSRKAKKGHKWLMGSSIFKNVEQ